MYDTFIHLPFERGRATVNVTTAHGPGGAIRRYTALPIADAGGALPEQAFTDGPSCMRALERLLGRFQPDRLQPPNRLANDVDVVTFRVRCLARMNQCGLHEVAFEAPLAA